MSDTRHSRCSHCAHHRDMANGVFCEALQKYVKERVERCNDFHPE